MKLALKHAVAAILLMLSFALPAVAGQLEDTDAADAAYAKGDYATALRLLRPLADQGDAAAQYNLGVMHANGRGVPQNYTEAAKWYHLAADQGDAPAQSNIGGLYAIGQGVPKNYISAYTWLSLSAAQGNQIAIKRRDIIARHMTPAQIAKAQKLAREWKPTKPQQR
jgi:uncharacterized protein